VVALIRKSSKRMPEIQKAERREKRHRRERYGQRGQAKWWHAVARSQARRANSMEVQYSRRTSPAAARHPRSASSDYREDV
jgi:hypothetical protein